MTAGTPLERLTDLFVLGGHGRQSAQLAEELLADHDAETAAAKGTRDATQAPAGEPTLSSDVLAFLTAIRDALTVPRVARSGDFAEILERRQRRDELLADRATTVRIAAQVIVDLSPRNLQAHLAAMTETIRGGIDAAPVDYEVWQDLAGEAVRDGGSAGAGEGR
ncbi:hypothetical protein [Actinacidiphila sp. ITFR-21]|uniref:hypothetical protein n=1 Tax=Actinacidiphila sp. ITFR-21 TaxID=3075199 RepID=UPI00288C04CA|nr:hypothetical protein [Streptomyces sp. ITFR-21]WNI16931.1 hypothetical protein RLT57_16305 [Streptomyces sp. ITFR-21]